MVLRPKGSTEERITRSEQSSDENQSQKSSKNQSKPKMEVISCKTLSLNLLEMAFSLHYEAATQTQLFALSSVLDCIFNLQSKTRFLSTTKDKIKRSSSLHKLLQIRIPKVVLRTESDDFYKVPVYIQCVEEIINNGVSI